MLASRYDAGMGSKNPEPRLVEISYGDALLTLIKVEIARREGDAVDGSDEALAGLFVQVLNQQPKLVLGLDCTGDGIPDGVSPAEIMKAVATGTCDCRADIKDDQSDKIEKVVDRW